MSTAASNIAAAEPSDRRQPRILVVDDERSMRELLAIVLRREGYDVLLAETGRGAIETLEREPIDLLISDLKMPDLSGVEVLRAAKRVDQDILGIMITAFASTETAVEAMRLGACDYLSKPFDIDLLKMKVREKIENRQLRQENVLLKRTLGLSHQFSNIIGRSESMLQVFKMIETVARTGSTILLTGESGTGKGLVAQAIHFHSLRREKPFVALNCGALPENLLESELFGHMRGAFTGADANKKGLLEVAERGTVFLDEIGEMPQQAQVKLLRVLQEKEVRPVGGTKSLGVDARIIAATNRPLRNLRGQYLRDDLYYRLATAIIEIPALRFRKEDIGVLARHFAEQCSVRYNREVSFDSTFLDELRLCDLPGNVRELESWFEFHTSMADPGPVEFTGAMVERSEKNAGHIGDTGAERGETARHRDGAQELSIEGVKADAIRRALNVTAGRRAKAAKLLGISRDTLWRKMRDFGVSVEKP
jgi:two-component system, NtrC family, response regulator PilR